jgi:hypothetical protein
MINGNWSRGDSNPLPPACNMVRYVHTVSGGTVYGNGK